MTDKEPRMAFTAQDRTYRTETPHIIDHLARSPQDSRLWGVVKMIAGDSGECFLNTEELASLCKMGVAKVSDSRAFWLAIGGLTGQLRTDPGFTQAVWHLSIPNLWPLNIAWRTRQEHVALRDRLALSDAYLAGLKAEKLQLMFDKGKWYSIPFFAQNFTIEGLAAQLGHEPSQYEGKASQYEGKASQYADKEITKKNHGEHDNKETDPESFVPDLKDFKPEPLGKQVTRAANDLLDGTWHDILEIVKPGLDAAQYESLFGQAMVTGFNGGKLQVTWPPMAFDRFMGYASRGYENGRGTMRAIEAAMAEVCPGVELEAIKAE